MTQSILPRFPIGWFAAAFSSELLPGRVLSRKLFGRDLVLFRGAGGVACATDAHCPHLGAHLGAGVVEGDCLRCPLHGFRFATNGDCVATGYGTKPPRAPLGTWPLDEQGGVIFLHHDPLRRAPTFHLPDVDYEGWSRPRFHYLETIGHPQEMAENTVDVGHLTWLHGYRGVRAIEPQRFDQHTSRVHYGIRRFVGIAGRFGRELPVEYTVDLCGLGFSRIESWMPTLGLRSRQVAMATPIEGDRVSIRFAISVAKTLDPRAQRPILERLWGPALASIAARVLLPMVLRDVGQDMQVWRDKRYLERPLLARGDGPFLAYRRWARQFYLPEANRSAAEDDTPLPRLMLPRACA